MHQLHLPRMCGVILLLIALHTRACPAQSDEAPPEAVLTGREFLPKAAEILAESQSDRELAHIDGLKRGEWYGQWRFAVERWTGGLLFLVTGPDELHND